LTVERKGCNLIFMWNTSSDNGAKITSYTVEIVDKKDSSWLLPLRCEEQFTSVKTSCQVPIGKLLEAPYNLIEGDLVQAQVYATNSIGRSRSSEVNTSGYKIEEIRPSMDAPELVSRNK